MKYLIGLLILSANIASAQAIDPGPYSSPAICATPVQSKIEIAWDGSTDSRTIGYNVAIDPINSVIDVGPALNYVYAAPDVNTKCFRVASYMLAIPTPPQISTRAVVTQTSLDTVTRLLTVSTAGTQVATGTIYASWAIKWGDGIQNGGAGTGVQPPPTSLNHTYAVNGTYLVEFEIVDSIGVSSKSSFSVVIGTVIPPPIEICGNGIDDDKDGMIDEGCPVIPPPSTSKVCKPGTYIVTRINNVTNVSQLQTAVNAQTRHVSDVAGIGTSAYIFTCDLQ